MSASTSPKPSPKALVPFPSASALRQRTYRLSSLCYSDAKDLLEGRTSRVLPTSAWTYSGRKSLWLYHPYSVLLKCKKRIPRTVTRARISRRGGNYYLVLTVRVTEACSSRRDAYSGDLKELGGTVQRSLQGTSTLQEDKNPFRSPHEETSRLQSALS